jgi:hypothetical protein
MPLLTMPVDMIKIDKVLVDRLAPAGGDRRPPAHGQDARHHRDR